MVISALRSCLARILLTRRPERGAIVRLLLEAAHNLLLVGIASRQYLNLLHWLPLLLAIVRAVCDYRVAKAGSGGIDAGGSGANEEKENDNIPSSVTSNILDAASDIFLYWSLVKIPARIVIVALCLPYAVTALSSTRHASATRTDKFLLPTVLATIAVVGNHFLETQKLDSFAFLQLCMAIMLKTIRLHPAVALALQNHILRLTRRIPRSTRLDEIVARLGVTPLITYNLVTTLGVYAMDAISQWSKRWSTLSHHCWMWTVGVLVVRGATELIDGGAGTLTTSSKADQEPGQADSEPQYDGIISQISQYLLSAFMAMVVVCAMPRWIDLGPGFVKTPGNLSSDERTTLYLAGFAICWSSLYFYRSRNIEEKPAYEAINLDPLSDPIALSNDIQRTSWLKVFLSVIAFVPLLLAAGKHTVSGTALQSIYDATRKTPEISVLKTVADPSHRRLGPRYLSPIPSVDVVIAYFSEPTDDLRRIVARIRGELTWARVRVVVYHKGIPGFGEEGVPHDGLDDVLATLKRETNADVVIPRRNLGRDMGVYLNHIVEHWEELAQQTIFLQAQPHELHLVWQRLRLLNPSVGFMSFGEYQLYADPIDLGNHWPFPEMPIAWDMFYPNVSMPTDEPILITWKGEIMLSLERIQMTGHEVWRNMRDVLVSEVGSEGHVGGFSWNGDEGPVSPYFGHIVERAWPLMAHCYSPQLYDDCAKYWWADNANGGCVCSDVKG